MRASTGAACHAAGPWRDQSTSYPHAAHSTLTKSPRLGVLRRAVSSSGNSHYWRERHSRSIVNFVFSAVCPELGNAAEAQAVTGESLSAIVTRAQRETMPRQETPNC